MNAIARRILGVSAPIAVREERYHFLHFRPATAIAIAAAAAIQRADAHWLIVVGTVEGEHPHGGGERIFLLLLLLRLRLRLRSQSRSRSRRRVVLPLSALAIVKKLRRQGMGNDRIFRPRDEQRGDANGEQKFGRGASVAFVAGANGCALHKAFHGVASFAASALAARIAIPL